MPEKSKLDLEAAEIIKEINSKDCNFWEKARKQNPLALFRLASKQVPAYKDFLAKNGINPKKIKTIDDLNQVPAVSRKNYLKNYPLKDLTWPDAFKSTTVFTSTSGSTGQPFFFPRNQGLDWQASVTHEMFLRWGTHDFKKPILIIDGFGMGAWIGGLLTYKAFEIISQRNRWPISLITPGVNKGEVFKTLATLGPQFGQIVLAGYPPFIKDILDEAGQMGINLKKLHLRLLFAAEPFTENFREHLAATAGIKNLYLDTSNVYGTADLGTTSCETPTSILIRRLAIKRPELFSQMFGPVHKTPTLAQYNPDFINFQAENGELLLTGNSALPLVRYAIGDNGGVFNYDQATAYLKESGLSLHAEAKKYGLNKHINQLPFVYVYERKDFSTTLYGLQVYPEYIREALIQKPLRKYLTGKFAMITKTDKNHNQFLEINLELRKKQILNHAIKKVAVQKILSSLITKSSEFKELYSNLKKRAEPRLVFWPAEHHLYFKIGAKQKWTLNQKV